MSPIALARRLFRLPSAPAPEKVFIIRAATKHQAELIRTKDGTTKALRAYVKRKHAIETNAYNAMAAALFADHVDAINANRKRAA